MSSKRGLRLGNNELPPFYLKECWADALHRKIIISDSSNLQDEKHMEIEALKNKFVNSGFTVFAFNVTGIIGPLLY